jgi:hypothetical protein
MVTTTSGQWERTMRHETCSVIAAAVLMVMAGETSAQSLGEIAEREKKRRAEQQAKGGPPTKVLSLENWQGWQAFQPSEKDFSVQFPARPRVSEDVVILPEAKVNQRVFQAVKDNVFFKVVTADLASTAYDRLPADQLLKVIASNVASMKDSPCSPISLDGNPGCEMQRSGVRGDYGSQTADLTSRVYVVKRRIYILTYGWLNDSGPAAESSGPFFASFSPRP